MTVKNFIHSLIIIFLFLFINNSFAGNTHKCGDKEIIKFKATLKALTREHKDEADFDMTKSVKYIFPRVCEKNNLVASLKKNNFRVFYDTHKNTSYVSAVLRTGFFIYGYSEALILFVETSDGLEVKTSNVSTTVF